jgi:hypothetical protein
MRNRVQSYLSDLYHISTNEVGNDADIRFNNLIQQLADNQNNYRLGDLDHPNLDN